jgi:hypothetical protein
MRTKFWFGSPKGRDHSEEVDVAVDNIAVDLRKIGSRLDSSGSG